MDGCILATSINSPTPPNSAYFLPAHLNVIRVQDKIHTYVHETKEEMEAPGNGPVLLEVSFLFWRVYLTGK